MELAGKQAFMKIATATESDRTIIFSMLAKAFAEDPYVSWLYPDRVQRMAVWPKVMETIGGRAIGCGTAYVTDDGRGAILWLPPGVESDIEKKVHIYKKSLPASRINTLEKIDRQYYRLLPDSSPWTLSIIAVKPGHQQQGIGTSLLEYSLQQIGSQTQDQFVLSCNPKNLSLYQRFGFRLLGRIQADDSPPLHPLLRVCH